MIDKATDKIEIPPEDSELALDLSLPREKGSVVDGEEQVLETAEGTLLAILREFG